MMGMSTYRLRIGLRRSRVKKMVPPKSKTTQAKGNRAMANPIAITRAISRNWLRRALRESGGRVRFKNLWGREADPTSRIIQTP
jgi:hypothetical protein